MNDHLYKKALRLEYFTIGYNIFEAIISIIVGKIANSISLVGFGLDSIVESLSGIVLIWRLKKHDQVSEEVEERIERMASMFVGITFFILGFFILFESIKKIILKEIPEISIIGIVIAVFSLIVMPILGSLKYRIGKTLNLPSLIADSKETFICSVLSATLLIGLVSMALFNFWLADPIVGLVIVVFLFKEGWELVFGEEFD